MRRCERYPRNDACLLSYNFWAAAKSVVAAAGQFVRWQTSEISVKSHRDERARCYISPAFAGKE
jgi:hypothetical protein